MNHYFKSFLFIFLYALCPSCILVSQQAMPQMSVQEMFQGLTEEEIVALMEEGQREMERIMTSGTKEEQERLMRDIEDTMKNFSPEDFDAINQIAKAVEPLLLEKEAQLAQEQELQRSIPQPIKQPIEKKQEIITADSSFEYMLYKINKTINSILVRAKSDPSLNEILKQWNKKDEFNELVRLLQVLNTKKIMNYVTTSTNESNKKLVQTIENFHKRLEIENKQFTIADSFGLEIDKETSIQNAQKLYTILDFFTNATDSLLPMITQFLKDFEPEALKLSQAHDEQAQSSLQAAKKIEQQKRPIGSYNTTAQAPSNGSNQYDYNRPNYNPRADYASSNINTPQGRRAQNKMDYHNSSMYQDENLNAPKAPTDKVTKKEDDKQKSDKKEDDKKSSENKLKPVIEKIERFDDMFDNSAFDDYQRALTAATETFRPFGREIPYELQDTDYEGFLHKNYTGMLTPQQSELKRIYAQKQASFKKDLQEAHTHYGKIKVLIDNITPQIKEIKTIADTTRSSLATLSIQDLEKLQNSTALKKLKSRFASYSNLFETVQKDLSNKHKRHKIQTGNPDEMRSYNELLSKIESLHGLDRVLIDTKSSLDLLNRAIKGEIKYKKRNPSVGK